MRRRVSGVRRRFSGRVVDRGVVTAEYAIIMLAACGFAGVLVAILRSGLMRGLLLGLVRRALSAA
jgi:Protein of unknown function (DUF4244)